MKKLSSIKVIGKKINVKYVETEEYWGYFDQDELTIYLSLNCLKNPERHEETLKHEIKHVILYLTGLAFLERFEEETLVRCIENLIIPEISKYTKT